MTAKRRKQHTLEQVVRKLRFAVACAALAAMLITAHVLESAAAA
jgi:hypothetical protein